MARTIHAPRPASLPKAPPKLRGVKWLTAVEASKLLPYTPKTILELARSGALESMQPNGPRARVWISEESVLDYIARGHREARAS